MELELIYPHFTQHIRPRPYKSRFSHYGDATWVKISLAFQLFAQKLNQANNNETSKAYEHNKENWLWPQYLTWRHDIETLSALLAPLWGESTGNNQWIPLTKGQ